ncbi:MAG: single-stranded DNA-binding protein [Cyanobacteria bacterium REEB67]|nr:single-stranded DNA-binding protein [Cyanobacteria bacterium REEB67]
MSLANISIVGNLVKAPEQIQFSSGRTKTTLVLAVNNVAKATAKAAGKTNGADFYRVETWGKLADLAAKYLSKGNQVSVSGRLVMDHWTDRHGAARVTPVVEATQLSLPPKPKAAGASPYPYDSDAQYDATEFQGEDAEAELLEETLLEAS